MGDFARIGHFGERTTFFVWHFVWYRRESGQEHEPRDREDSEEKGTAVPARPGVGEGAGDDTLGNYPITE
jgi:hypothetical protein